MTTFLARSRQQGKVIAGKVAELSGSAIRRVGVSVPGVGGPLLVSAGLWMAWRPLGVMFAGAVLWALDRRV